MAARGPRRRRSLWTTRSRVAPPGHHPRMLLRSTGLHGVFVGAHAIAEGWLTRRQLREGPYVRVLHGVYAEDRKSTRLNSSHANISYAVFCLKKKLISQEHT